MCVVVPRLSCQGGATPSRGPSSGGASPALSQFSVNGATSALPEPHRPKGVPAPLEPSRLRRGKEAFLLPLTHDRRRNRRNHPDAPRPAYVDGMLFGRCIKQADQSVKSSPSQSAFDHSEVREITIHRRKALSFALGYVTYV